MKRTKLALFALLFLLATALVGGMYLAGRFAPSETFREGYYTISDSGMHGMSYELHDGRFEYIGYSDIADETLTGQYDVSNDRVRLTFDDPKHQPWMRELFWRNVGGVPVLLTSKAAATFDAEKKLVSYSNGADFAEFFVFKRKPDEGGRLWFFRLVVDYPEFGKALTGRIRERYSKSWWQYQRMRWRNLPYEHPELHRRLPGWLQTLF